MRSNISNRRHGFTKRTLARGGLGLAAVTAAASIAIAADTVSAQLAEIISRTRRASVTYSLYAHDRLSRSDGTVLDEWAAEFNSGQWHRVETPRDRMIANCVTGEGSYLNLVTREVSHDPWIAKASCGINANRAVESGKWLGVRDTKYGRVERVSLTDSASVRTYDVNADGVIVAATISDLEGKPFLANWACSLSTKLPRADIFSEASLQTSAVPAAAKTSSSNCPAWHSPGT